MASKSEVKAVTPLEPKGAAVSAREETAVSRPTGPFEEMERLMQTMMSDVFPRGWLWPGAWERPTMREWASMRLGMPRVDVIERDEEVVVRAELPGVDKKNVDVSLTRDSVTLSGEVRREEKEQEKGSYFRSEMSRGSFSRTVGLPADVDTEKATASFKEGVLELVLPKLEKVKRRRIRLE